MDVNNSTFANLTFDDLLLQIPVISGDFIISCGVVLVLICTFGICGNGFSLAIFLQRSFRCLSINVFLAALSAADLCLLVLALPVYAAGPLLYDVDVKHGLRKAHAYIAIHLYPVTYMFHCSSIWLLVAVTLDRWMAVCKPLSVATYCKRNRSIAAVCSIVSLAVLFNLVRFWEIKMDADWVEPKLMLRSNRLYVLLYVTIASIICVYVVPFMAMLFFNIKIAIEITRSRKSRSKMSSLQHDDQQTALMLLFVVLCFICCYTPSFILNLCEAISPHIFATALGYNMSVANNVFVLLNSATTFLFYLKFSSRYRHAAHCLMARICCRTVTANLALHREETIRLCTLVDTSPSVIRSRRWSIHRNSMLNDSFRPRTAWDRLKGYKRASSSASLGIHENSMRIKRLKRGDSSPSMIHSSPKSSFMCRARASLKIKNYQATGSTKSVFSQWKDKRFSTSTIESFEHSRRASVSSRLQVPPVIRRMSGGDASGLQSPRKLSIEGNQGLYVPRFTQRRLSDQARRTSVLAQLVENTLLMHSCE